MGISLDHLEMFRDPAQDIDDDLEAVRRAAGSGVLLGSRAQRKLIVVAGAKGGVGKTFLASNVALYLATIGRKVVIVDADPEGANVHTFLGFALDCKGTESADANDTLSPAPTPYPGLQLLRACVEDATSRRSDSVDVLDRLRELDADFVVVDLGAGTRGSQLDLWLSADIPLFITIPEPTALENTYRYVRLLFLRYVRKLATEGNMRRRIDDAVRDFGCVPEPIDLRRRFDGTALGEIVASAMTSFSFNVTVNQTRMRADLDLGDGMRSATWRKFGLQVSYLGYIDYDDTAWTCARLRRPLLVESPGTKASKAIEKVTRRLLALDASKKASSRHSAVPAGSHHDLLDVGRGATDEEIRRAFKRARDIYASESLCCYGLFTAPSLEGLRLQIEQAYDVLLDPVRRRPYELSVFPEEPVPDADNQSQGLNPETLPPAPLIAPETEFSGPLLRAVRESKGLDLREMSRKTKIGLPYLQAIEDDDFGALPAPVYVRGFVAELAKCLKLDSQQVSRSYVRRYKPYFEARQHGVPSVQ